MSIQHDAAIIFRENNKAYGWIILDRNVDAIKDSVWERQRDDDPVGTEALDRNEQIYAIINFLHYFKRFCSVDRTVKHFPHQAGVVRQNDTFCGHKLSSAAFS